MFFTLVFFQSSKEPKYSINLRFLAIKPRHQYWSCSYLSASFTKDHDEFYFNYTPKSAWENRNDGTAYQKDIKTVSFK